MDGGWLAPSTTQATRETEMYAYVTNHFDGEAIFTVGFFTPEGAFHTDSDWISRTDAAQRVHYLNGGDGDPLIEEWRGTKEYQRKHPNSAGSLVRKKIRNGTTRHIPIWADGEWSS
jgi:hypothetical protein